MSDDFAFTYTKVTVEEIKEEQKEPPKVTEDFTGQRKAEAPAKVELLDATAHWILSLPEDVRPMAMAKKYPRIANTLAKAWPFPLAFEARLKEYMLDDRSPRQGFPLDVVTDFANLKKHFRKVDTRFKGDVWHEIEQ